LKLEIGMKQREKDREALRSALQRYGADGERWPDRLQPLLSDPSTLDPDDQTLIEEARALDALLDAGDCETAFDVSDPAVAAMTDRIVVAAKDQTAAPGPVVPFRPRQARSVGPGAPLQRRFEGNAAGALLAASLMLGIFAGASGWVDTAVAPVASAIGLNGEDVIDVTDASADIYGLAGLADELL
jgi:hypothetical protein